MAQFTAKEMLAYRDSVVKCLKDELELLADMQQYGMFNKDEGIITRHNYPEKVEIIEGEITKLENFDVVLSVVGTMKAGKSTTINAIVGREILPNRNRPMTALPTLIYHTPEQTEPVLSFHNQAVNEFVGKLKTHLQNHTHLHDELSELKTDEMKALIAKIQAGWTFQPEYHGEEAIFEFLAGLNDLVRLAGYINNKDKSIEFPFTECRNIEQLPQIKVAFRHLTDMPANQGRLVLLDTPGPNEAGQQRLRGMLTEQLQRSSAVMLVLDYTQLKSEASDGVKQQLEAVPTISKERLFALVNKFDQKNANSDDEEQTKNLISQEFLPEKIEREHIYPLAAQTAFLANRMAAELVSTGKPEWTESGWFNDFIKLAYGTRMKANKWEHEEIEDIQEAIDELIEDSRVQIPLQEAIIQTQMEAPKIALQAAIHQLRSIMYEVYNFTNTYANDEILGSEKKIDLLNQKLQELDKQVEKLTHLQTKTKEELPETLNKIKQELDNEFSAIKENISNIINGDFSKQEEKLKADLKKQEEQKIRWYHFDIWGEKRKERNFLFERLKIQLADIQSNRVSSFSERDEAKKFFNQSQTEIQSLILEITQNIQSSVNSAQEIFGTEIHNIQAESHSLFDEIHHALQKEGFQLEKPDFQTKELRTYEFQFPQMEAHIHKKERVISQPTASIFGKVKRWFGNIFNQDDWGYESKTVDEYQISGKEIKEAFLKPVNDYLNTSKEEIDNIFEEFQNEWIVAYVGNIRDIADNLLNEVRAAIQANRDNQYRAEEYRKQMKCFANHNNDIREDYEKVANVINAM